MMLGQLASLRRVQNEKTHALIYFVVIAPSGSQVKLKMGKLQYSHKVYAKQRSRAVQYHSVCINYTDSRLGLNELL